jgi:hypothetical protein
MISKKIYQMKDQIKLKIKLKLEKESLKRQIKILDMMRLLGNNKF